jgi:hypothetical protein
MVLTLFLFTASLLEECFIDSLHLVNVDGEHDEHLLRLSRKHNKVFDQFTIVVLGWVSNLLAGRYVDFV